MQFYLELFDEIKNTIIFTEKDRGFVTNEQERRQIIERMAATYQIHLVEAEIWTILCNLETF